MPGDSVAPFIGDEGGGGGPKENSMYDATSRSTGGGVFVDAFGGVVLNPPAAGDYFLIFESEIEGSAASSAIEVVITKNGVTVVVPDTERSNGMGADQLNVLTTVRSNGAILTDDFSGSFRKASGGGTVFVIRKRLTMIEVT